MVLGAKLAGLFEYHSAVSRLRRYRLFETMLRPGPLDTVLEVGGVVSRKGRWQFVDHYPWPNRVTVLNCSEAAIRRVRTEVPAANGVVGDATRLPFPDKAYDLVHSNAVIEHIPREHQRSMAREIMRVGQHWFVATPNRWYPFEFHVRLPLIHWLPRRFQGGFASLFRWDHRARSYQFGPGGRFGTTVDLLDAGELKRLFPGSAIVKQRVTFWPETLIAVSPRGL